MLGMANYTNDYGMWIPYKVIGTSGNGEINWVKNFLRNKYAVGKVFICASLPANPGAASPNVKEKLRGNNAESLSATQASNIDYCYNSQVLGGQADGGKSKKNVKNASSKVIALFDSVNKNNTFGGYAIMSGGCPSFRHNSSCVTGWADGHISSEKGIATPHIGGALPDGLNAMKFTGSIFYWNGFSTPDKYSKYWGYWDL